MVGNDRPGIVNEVSHVLAGLGIGIVDLQTWTESGAMAGRLLLRAAAEVRLPTGVGSRDVATALEDLADDLMVDLARATVQPLSRTGPRGGGARPPASNVDAEVPLIW